MEVQYFDDLARGLDDGTVSRRWALKLLAGGALAAVAGWRIGVKESDAVEVARDNQTCADKPAISNRRCPRNVPRCGGKNFCTCARTVDGDKKCIDLRTAHCPTIDECDSDRDCGSGRVCVEVGACCGHERRNACWRRCP
jgi:hypothetical protein